MIISIIKDEKIIFLFMDSFSRGTLSSVIFSFSSFLFEIVSENFLKKMKPTGFLIKTSRGKVVDQEALKKALMQRNIGGAALDVFVEEPPVDKDFLSLPNLMVTPHIGGNAVEGVEAMVVADRNVLLAWKEPNRVLGRGEPLTRGNHGSPGCTQRVAIVAGGHPAAKTLGGAITQNRPGTLTWAPTIRRLLKV